MTMVKDVKKKIIKNNKFFTFAGNVLAAGKLLYH